MTIFTKVMTAAMILSSLGITSSAYAQDANTPSSSETPATAWLLTIVAPQNQARLQTLRTDLPSQQFTPLPNSAQFTAWTDREPLVLAQTREEKYVRTDLSNFSYPVLGPIAYGVRPEPTEVAAFNNAYQTSSVVNPSFGDSPYNQNIYSNRKNSAAQLHFKF